MFAGVWSAPLELTGIQGMCGGGVYYAEFQ